MFYLILFICGLGNGCTAVTMPGPAFETMKECVDMGAFNGNTYGKNSTADHGSSFVDGFTCVKR